MTAPALHATSANDMDWLISFLSPEQAAALTRPLTDVEYALIDDALARHNGDPVAALGVTVDPTTAALIRALPIGVRS